MLDDLESDFSVPETDPAVSGKGIGVMEALIGRCLRIFDPRLSCGMH